VRKVLIVLAVFATTAVMSLIPAIGRADVNDPGSGCNDQVNGASCVPDPQPTNGQDCDAHGANADGNENHCLDETTTSPTVTTPGTSTTSTTVSDTTTIETTSTTSTVVSTVSEGPPVSTSSPVSSSTETPTETESTDVATPTDTEGPKRTTTGKLAFTGVEDVVPVAAAALALLALGTGLLWRGRARFGGRDD